MVFFTYVSRIWTNNPFYQWKSVKKSISILDWKAPFLHKKNTILQTLQFPEKHAKNKNPPGEVAIIKSPGIPSLSKGEVLRQLKVFVNIAKLYS